MTLESELRAFRNEIIYQIKASSSREELTHIQIKQLVCGLLSGTSALYSTTGFIIAANFLTGGVFTLVLAGSLVVMPISIAGLALVLTHVESTYTPKNTVYVKVSTKIESLSLYLNDEQRKPFIKKAEQLKTNFFHEIKNHHFNAKSTTATILILSTMLAVGIISLPILLPVSVPVTILICISTLAIVSIGMATAALPRIQHRRVAKLQRLQLDLLLLTEIQKILGFQN